MDRRASINWKDFSSYSAAIWLAAIGTAFIAACTVIYTGCVVYAALSEAFTPPQNRGELDWAFGLAILVPLLLFAGVQIILFLGSLRRNLVAFFFLGILTMLEVTIGTNWLDQKLAVSSLVPVIMVGLIGTGLFLREFGDLVHASYQQNPRKLKTSIVIILLILAALVAKGLANYYSFR